MSHPYNLEGQHPNYEFKTANGREYAISLFDQSSRLSKYCRFQIPFIEISIIRLDFAPIPGDYRVKVTVVEFMTRLLQNDPKLVILAVTDGGDGKAKERSRLFNSWIGNTCPDWVDFVVVNLENDGAPITGYSFFSSAHPQQEAIKSSVVDYFQGNYS